MRYKSNAQESQPVSPSHGILQVEIYLNITPVLTNVGSFELFTKLTEMRDRFHLPCILPARLTVEPGNLFAHKEKLPSKPCNQWVFLQSSVPFCGDKTDVRTHPWSTVDLQKSFPTGIRTPTKSGWLMESPKTQPANKRCVTALQSPKTPSEDSWRGVLGQSLAFLQCSPTGRGLPCFSRAASSPLVRRDQSFLCRFTSAVGTGSQSKVLGSNDGTHCSIWIADEVRHASA